ncbi:hypothetical protein EDM54_17070 [Brevibacillus borstelensis]|nr:hypothetical protein EDM54_17070 [Brevibacillus borstelensis]GED51406.1 hypothetical protein BBO01nite_06470 [Brevibacillus borstelensis]
MYRRLAEAGSFAEQAIEQAIWKKQMNWNSRFGSNSGLRRQERLARLREKKNGEDGKQWKEGMKERTP